MTINDLKLLDVKVYDGENVIYEGKCEDAPEEIIKKSITVLGLHGTLMEVKIQEKNEE